MTRSKSLSLPACAARPSVALREDLFRSYVMFTITRMASMFAVALMVLNGIDNMACDDKKEWDWLKTVNWIFVALYGIFFAYSGYKLFRP